MERVMKKIVLDPYRGGDDIGSQAYGILEKDYNLALSQYIYRRLLQLGATVSLSRTGDETLNLSDRAKRIQSFYGKGDDVVVISNALTSGGNDASIVYALRNSDGLSSKIAQELKKAGIEVEKYYQRRLPSDTALDYHELIRGTKNNESIIIYYGNIDNEKEANYLKNHMEEVGEAIVIALANYLSLPYQKVTGNYYVVQKGDSLYSIAKKYNTSVNELKTINHLESNTLQIGDVLVLPGEDKNTSSDILYSVKKGDSLYQIGKKYGVSVSLLKEYNHLNQDSLQIGQVLKIPSSDTDYLTYEVQKGDSLYSIAKKYNTSVNALKELNQLSSNLLQIGDILKVPASEKGSLNYTVQKGDSLYSIAKKYNTSVDKIKQLNQLSSNLLQIGDILKIPQ